MKRTFWLELCCALLILLFAYVGASKIANYPLFFSAMKTQPFPRWMGLTIAATLPVVELVIAGLLFFNKTRRPALIISTALMILFTAYSALFAFHIASRLPCICGGIMEKLSWKDHFFVNLFFTGISIAGITLQKQKSPVNPNHQPSFV